MSSSTSFYRTSSTTTTTTASPPPPPDSSEGTSGEIVFSSLIVFLLAIVFLFFLRLGVTFCFGYREDHSCRDTCCKFFTFSWVCDECRRTARDPRTTPPPGDPEQGSTENHASANPLYDLPAYEDALGLPRLDSSTIVGEPPPLYSSVVKGNQNPCYTGSGELNSNGTTMESSSLEPTSSRNAYEQASVSAAIQHDVIPATQISDVVFPRAMRVRVVQSEDHDPEENSPANLDEQDTTYNHITSRHQDSTSDLNSLAEPTSDQSPVCFTIGTSAMDTSSSENDDDPETLPSYEEATEINLGTSF